MTAAGPEPGWYFDPGDGTRERYWNGAVWTEHSRLAPTLPPAPPPEQSWPIEAAPSPEQSWPAPPVPDVASAAAGSPSPKGPPTYTVAAYAEASPQSAAAPAPPSSPLSPLSAGSSTELWVGGWARVILGDKRYLGRVGEVAAIGPTNDVDLKFTGSLGTYGFRRHQLAAVAAGGRAGPTAPLGDGVFVVGGWARIVVGDKRYLGRVGQIVAVDASGNADLKFAGSFGTFSFRQVHLVAMPGPSG